MPGQHIGTIKAKNLREIVGGAPRDGEEILLIDAGSDEIALEAWDPSEPMREPRFVGKTTRAELPDSEVWILDRRPIIEQMSYGG